MQSQPPSHSRFQSEWFAQTLFCSSAFTQIKWRPQSTFRNNKMKVLWQARLIRQHCGLWQLILFEFFSRSHAKPTNFFLLTEKVKIAVTRRGAATITISVAQPLDARRPFDRTFERWKKSNIERFCVCVKHYKFSALREKYPSMKYMYTYTIHGTKWSVDGNRLVGVVSGKWWSAALGTNTHVVVCKVGRTFECAGYHVSGGKASLFRDL